MSIAMIQAFKRTGLDPTDRLVAYMLADHHNADTGRCDPSFLTLEEETGLCRRTLGRAIDRIENLGHLTVKKVKGIRHSYVLHPQNGVDSKSHVNGAKVPTSEVSEWTESPMTRDSDDTQLGTLSAISSVTESHESERTVIGNRKEPEGRDCPCPPNENSDSEIDPVVARLYALIRRPSSLRMSREERVALRSAGITTDHLAAVEAYYAAAPHPDWNGKDLRCKSLPNLLAKWATAVTAALQWQEKQAVGDDETDEFQQVMNLIFGRNPLAKWSQEEMALYQSIYNIRVGDSDLNKLKIFYACRRLTKEQEFHRPKSLVEFLKKFSQTLDMARQFVTPSAL